MPAPRDAPRAEALLTPPLTFNPGPAQLDPGVRADVEEAFERGIPSLSHRTDAAREILLGAQDGVRRVLGLPDGYRVLFLASATEAMEVIIRNLSRQHTMHSCFGAFSKRFHETAVQLGRQAVAVERPEGQGMDLADLAADRAELACLTHSETATGAQLRLHDLAAWRERWPDALVAVDVVSSAPVCPMPWPHADCWFFSVQKACGLPAGLCVLIVGPRALQRSRELEEAGADLGVHRRFSVLERFAATGETVETPNVLGIYLLGRVMERFQARGGVDGLARDAEEKAAWLHAWLDGHARLRAFVRRREHRSPTVTSVEVPPGADPAALRKAAAAEGLVIGAGYGRFKASQLRIASFPAHSMADVQRAADAIDRHLRS